MVLKKNKIFVKSFSVIQHSWKWMQTLLKKNFVSNRCINKYELFFYIAIFLNHFYFFPSNKTFLEWCMIILFSSNSDDMKNKTTALQGKEALFFFHKLQFGRHYDIMRFTSYAAL